MARRPKKEINTSEWMNTYADMVTLLLCFFVLLFSMSSVSEQKWKIVIGSFNPDATVLVPIPVPDGDASGEDPPDSLGDLEEMTVEEIAFDEMAERFQAYIEENGLENAIELMRTEEGAVFITFENDIMFDGDSSRLRAEALPILDAFSGALEEVRDYVNELRILGHTNRINVASPNIIRADRLLANNRAGEVLVYLQEKGIISGSKMQSIGYGEFYPIAPHDTEEDARKNRRVEILIMSNEQVVESMEQVYAEIGRQVLLNDD